MLDQITVNRRTGRQTSINDDHHQQNFGTGNANFRFSSACLLFSRHKPWLAAGCAEGIVADGWKCRPNIERELIIDCRYRRRTPAPGALSVHISGFGIFRLHPYHENSSWLNRRRRLLPRISAILLKCRPSSTPSGSRAPFRHFTLAGKLRC